MNTLVASQLLTRLTDARDETDQLFRILKPATLYDRPIAERHRIVFYVGHLEAFDWNLLRTHLQLDRFHPEFDQLFAFGIDPVDGGLPEDGPEDWPSLSQIDTYRSRIRHELDAALSDVDETEELVQLLNIAIEHRLMHAETLEYMLHQLPFESKVLPHSNLVPRPVVEVGPQMIAIPAGSVILGLERGSGQFGWDNEFEAFSVEVPAFSIATHKVTNREFTEFVKAGGYRQRQFWSESDWTWVTSIGLSYPVFWIPDGDGYSYRSMFEQVPLPPNAPAYVSHAEASAYARWQGKALPTEAEWQRAAQGAAPPTDARTLWDPPAIGSSPDCASSFGVQDLYGTGWEWTSSTFSPFPGFQTVAAYPGYSANFFDGKHYVMKGGSPRTANCMLRKTFRNWFQAHYPYVYAGFRCVSH